MPSPSKKQAQPHLSLMTNSNDDDYLKLADAGISNDAFQTPPTPQTATTNICDSMEFISATPNPNPNTVNTKHTNNTDELVLRNNSNNNINKNNKNDNTPYYTNNNGAPHGHYRYTLPLSLTAPLPQPLPPPIAQQQEQQLQKVQQHDDKYRLYTIYGNGELHKHKC